MSARSVIITTMSLNLGGAETHVVSLAKQLHEEGCQVTVASSGGQYVPLLHPIPHVSIPLHSRMPHKLMAGRRRFEKLVNNEACDILHAHGRIPAWVCRNAGAKMNIPLVTTYHGVYASGFPWKWVTVPGDHTIAVSQDVSEHLQRAFDFSPQKISIIPNGIDLSLYKPQAKQEAAAQLQLNPDATVISHLSRLDGAFADTALCLIQACDQLLSRWPDLQLVIAGDGNRMAEVRREAQRARTRVHVLGALVDTVPVYNSSDVVVAVARTAMEALACQRPVIIAGEGGLVGPLTHANQAALEEANFTARTLGQALNTEHMARLLDFVLGHSTLREEMAELGRPLIEKKYSIGAATAAIMEVYEHVIRTH